MRASCGICAAHAHVVLGFVCFLQHYTLSMSNCQPVLKKPSIALNIENTISKNNSLFTHNHCRCESPLALCVCGAGGDW